MANIRQTFTKANQNSNLVTAVESSMDQSCNNQWTGTSKIFILSTEELY